MGFVQRHNIDIHSHESTQVLGHHETWGERNGPLLQSPCSVHSYVISTYEPEPEQDQCSHCKNTTYTTHINGHNKGTESTAAEADTHTLLYIHHKQGHVDPPEAPDDIDSNLESEEDQRGQCVVRPKRTAAQKSEERRQLWIKELTEEV